MFSTMLDMFELRSIVNGVLGAATFTGIALLFTQTKKLPNVLKYYRKLSRYKELLKIKNNRDDDRYYLYELQKAQNWFITFLFVITVNFVFLISNGILNFSTWLFFILMTPSFIVEILWLNKVSYVEDLRVYQKGNLEWKKRKQRKNRRRAKKLRSKVLS